jgi:hypothetical protein
MRERERERQLCVCVCVCARARARVLKKNQNVSRGNREIAGVGAWGSQAELQPKQIVPT